MNTQDFAERLILLPESAYLLKLLAIIKRRTQKKRPHVQGLTLKQLNTVRCQAKMN